MNTVTVMPEHWQENLIKCHGWRELVSCLLCWTYCQCWRILGPLHFLLMHNYSSIQSLFQISVSTSICFIFVACNLRTCAVCRLHGAKYAVCRLHGTQSADCMVTVQTKDPSKTCDSFSKFQRSLRFSARINFLTKLPI